MGLLISQAFSTMIGLTKQTLEQTLHFPIRLLSFDERTIASKYEPAEQVPIFQILVTIQVNIEVNHFSIYSLAFVSRFYVSFRDLGSCFKIALYFIH